MYQKCPKCNHQRRSDETANPGICPACGLVFAKWVARVTGGEQRQGVGTGNATLENGGDDEQSWVSRLTWVEPRTDPMFFWARCGLWLVFLIWGWYFILLDFRTNEIGASFMHVINLVFHEAGHVLFRAFGQFMHVLGGSLAQLLMPAIVTGVFVIKNRDNFGASIGLWWLGQSLMDLAPYINDARDLQLPLLTGHSQDVPETHDWANILLDLGLIMHEKKIAFMADLMGTLIVLLALVWGGYLLLCQYRNLERD